MLAWNRYIVDQTLPSEFTVADKYVIGVTLGLRTGVQAVAQRKLEVVPVHDAIKPNLIRYG